MSPGERNNKITPEHLRKNAYLYIRQSTLHQVLENTESTRRQYELRQHRLLEICALSSTLILDEDGVYNPAHFNDRLLLGLKGPPALMGVKRVGRA